MSHLSHSSISTFQQCGMRWKLTKRDNVPEAPSGSLIVGHSCHSVFESAGRTLLDGARHTEIALLPLQSAFLQTFSAELERADPLHVITYAEASLLAARGLAIVRAWHERVLPHFHPLAVEEDFEGPLVTETDDAQYTGHDDPLLDWTFTGRRDARTLARQGAGQSPLRTTLDFKTAEKPWDERKANGDGMAQATAYAWGDLLDGRPISQQFTYCVLHTTVPADWTVHGDPNADRSAVQVQLGGADEIVPYDGYGSDDDGISVEVNYWRLYPSMSDVRAYQRRAVATARAILAGDQFAPNPSPLCCWCGVLPHCEMGARWVRAQSKHQPLPVIQRFAEVVMQQTAQEASPCG